MDLALAGSLAALALIDSTSFGTLLIPIWLLLTPGRVRLGRMLVFLGTIAVFYFAVGVLIALGAGVFFDELAALLDTPAASWIQLVLGVGLLVLSFRIDPGKKERRTPDGGGRVARWRSAPSASPSPPRSTGRPSSALARRAPLVGLALAAATVEVATMLPYLAAIGLITAAGIGAAQTALTMAGYCLVMILPALLLVFARMAARRAVELLLNRINDWMTKNAAGTTAWIVGIVGFLVARDAVVRLDLLDVLNRL
ncbi:GAP family protein [Glycomyces albus]